jgi:hypothetical protein
MMSTYGGWPATARAALNHFAGKIMDRAKLSPALGGEARNEPCCRYQALSLFFEKHAGIIMENET